MRKMLIATAAVLTLLAGSVPAGLAGASGVPIRALPGSVPARPLHFGPRLPLALFTVVTEIDQGSKTVDIRVPVDSPAYRALQWDARTTLYIDGAKVDEQMMYPGQNIVLTTEQELDQELHRACVRLVRIADPPILPDTTPIDCKTFTHYGPPPRLNALGR